MIVSKMHRKTSIAHSAENRFSGIPQTKQGISTLNFHRMNRLRQADTVAVPLFKTIIFHPCPDEQVSRGSVWKLAQNTFALDEHAVEMVIAGPLRPSTMRTNSVVASRLCVVW